MRKIHNAYDDIKEHICFACSKKNPVGLQMEFYEDGDEVISKWQPREEFSGFHNVLHGGIQAVLIDEVAAWCIMIKRKTFGMTVGFENRYKSAVFMDKGALTLRAKIVEERRNIITVEVKMFDNDNTLCTESRLQFFAFPEKVAREKYHFPDYELFFTED